jgi:hypothetical protein
MEQVFAPKAIYQLGMEKKVEHNIALIKKFNTKMKITISANVLQTNESKVR